MGTWAGPQHPRLLLIGEAWGEQEDLWGAPFVGTSGQELWRMLGEAAPEVLPEAHAQAARAFWRPREWLELREPWLAAASIAFTNVFNLRPPGNQRGELCHKTPLPGWPPLGRVGKEFPNGAHLQPQYWPQVERLFEEIAAARPNLIVAAGNTACWAVLRTTAIGTLRGAITSVPLEHPEAPLRGLKVLPMFHPAAIMRQWSQRPVAIADLMKALRESEFPEVRRPSRQILVNPTLADLDSWALWLASAPPAALACDIETAYGEITCIGFARSRSEAIVVPFYDPGHASGCYWPTPEAESTAWRFVRTLLEGPVPKVFQNGMYDLQYIAKRGIRPRGLAHDTMLLHHSLFPEMRKGLGFLGSIYTNEPAWKLMRRGKPDTEKRDE